ncbi:hypothetical protein PAMP_017851 [Pampus punctatissimus]
MSSSRRSSRSSRMSSSRRSSRMSSSRRSSRRSRSSSSRRSRISRRNRMSSSRRSRSRRSSRRSRITQRHETVKDGTVWTVIQSGKNSGKRKSHNVFTEAAGPTAYAKRNIEDALTSFLCCVVDDAMLKHIRACTVAEAHRVREESSWDMSVNELKAFSACFDKKGISSRQLEVQQEQEEQLSSRRSSITLFLDLSVFQSHRAE